MILEHSTAIIIRNQKVLLIKRSLQEDSEPGTWCAPNETLEENESPEEAVIRGVYEELGMTFVVTKWLFEHSYQGHTTFVFQGDADGEITPNPEEVAEYGYFSYQEATRLQFAYDYNKVISGLRDLKLIAD